MAGLGTLLAGCASRGPASVAGGECHIFGAPKYVIHGRAQYDQDWIDDNTEAGIAACRWSRPKERPVAAKPKGNKSESAPVSTVAAPPPAKKRWRDRVRDYIKKKKEAL